MLNLPLCGNHEFPSGSTVTISNLTKIRVGSYEETVGIGIAPDGQKVVIWVSWGYAGSQWVPQHGFICNPFRHYAHFIEYMADAITEGQMQYYYDYAVLWRKVCRWSHQMGLDGRYFYNAH